ncbi:protein DETOXIFICATION 51-like [Silene latifolia]|uniref:protein DETOXIFICATION 51-like n=1 Tax=Silene latifolia TaxID=37657 RepID=UPI003D76A9B1
MCNLVSDEPPNHSKPNSQVTNIYCDLVSLNSNLQEKKCKKTDDENNNSDSNSFSELSLFSFPSFMDVVNEIGSLFFLAFPILLTNLILYSRSMLSMVYLGQIGANALAAGSLAIAFANITGYSVFSGLALGMEPLCSQAFGANRPKILSLTLQRCVIFLLVCTLPISVLWFSMSYILDYLHQDPEIVKLAHTYILFSLPDLFTNSFYHPIKIYLRAQGITRPVTVASLIGAVVHLPIMAILVGPFKLGIVGVAVATSTSNLASLVVLVIQIRLSGLHVETWDPPGKECLTGWEPLIKLAFPSCVTVCLEWWWYEIMIMLCGLLVNPKATVASMGILMQTTGLIYNFPAALSNAISTRVGNELGAGQIQRAKLSSLVGIMWALIMGLAAFAFAFGSKHVWAQMFTHDRNILSLTSTALPILGLCELGNCPQTAAAGVIRGTARPTTAANAVLGAFYGVGMPVAIGLTFYLGVGFNGLWIGLLAAQISCAGLLFFVVGTTDWVNQAKMAELLTQCVGPTLDLPTSFTVDSSLHDNDERSLNQVAHEIVPLMSISVAST